jgi:hypothetical protein
LVLDDGGLDWIDELTVELSGELHEEGFVDAEAFGSVGREVAVAGDVLVWHADGGGETAEEETAGLQDSPEALQHGVEVSVVAREVEDGVAEDDVEEGVGEGHGLDGFDAKVFGGEVGALRCRESAGLLDRRGVLIDGEDLVSLAQKIDEVAAGAGACVEDTHAGCDVAAEELIEEVDVDGAELFLKGGHGCSCMIREGRYGCALWISDWEFGSRSLPLSRYVSDKSRGDNFLTGFAYSRRR